jgi:prepilin peptidase CpaA
VTAIYFVAFAAFPLGMALAAVSDLATMTIPNRLVLVLLAAFLVAAPLSGMELATFGLHLAAGFVVLAVAFGCFAMGWIGGGDAKLAAVIMLWLGVESGVAFLLVASLFGGVLTVALLLFRRQVWPAFVNQAWVQRLHDRNAGVPYGVALAAAALIVYPKTAWMTMALG